MSVQGVSIKKNPAMFAAYAFAFLAFIAAITSGMEHSILLLASLSILLAILGVSKARNTFGTWLEAGFVLIIDAVVIVGGIRW